MTQYQVTMFDYDGSVWSTCVIECLDDEEALELAGEFTHPHRMELHRGARLLGSFPKATAAKSAAD